ncbi:MFS transporter [Deinococcus seoulensis]|uniref:MFS transporter n=2 Tax=Deinococcus TaxID=1298 RepID=A0ABQ2RTI2_9DEIO|nr:MULTISPECIES: MFS transporter [Deinococcus]GGR64416.1 MFS transporter [Deinococcus seoulensis]GGS21830.1 MFS transporter [Deinococcus knuensis]
MPSDRVSPEVRAAHPAGPSRRWLALGLLAASVVLSMSPWFSAAAVIGQLRAEWAVSDRASAWLTLAVQLGFVLGAVLSAALNLPDRVSPRRLIAAGSLAAAAANAALLLAHGPLEGTLLRALTGAALALVYPVTLKLMSAHFARGRGLALGVMVGALTLGGALPHLVNGLGGADWRAVIGVTSVLAALGGLLALSVPPAPGGPVRAPPFQPGRAWQAVTRGGVGLSTLGYLGHMWELYAMWTWFAVYYAAQTGPGSPGRAALATALVVGVGALGCVLGGVLGDRWGRTRLTTLAMLLSGGAALLLAALTFLHAPPGLLLAVGVFWGFWIIADSAQFSTVVSEIADPQFVGTALTAQLALGFTLTAVTIALVPVLVGAAGWPAALAVLAAGPLLGAWAMQRLARHPDARLIAGGRG